MSRWWLTLPCLLAAGAACAQSPPSALDVANLQEDVRGLTQKVNDLSLQVEQLQRQNGDLRNQAGAVGYATIVQLNQAVAELNQAIQSAVANSRADTLQQMTAANLKLAQQLNAALSSAGKKGVGGTAEGNFSDDYPKTGESYTVQKGDTLAVIAKKTGAKRQDIINANKLSDPGRIQAGQTLFIPEGK